MKKSLGSLILLFAVSLFGSSLCNYHFKVSNFNPYEKEAVKIDVEVIQVDSSMVMYFDLIPQKSKDFEIHLLSRSENKKSYHDNKTVYHYTLFPLKSGTIELKFDLKVSQATDEGVEKFYTGNRDVINPMATKESIIDIKPLLFKVKPLKGSVSLVGDFELDMKIDRKEVSSFEQVNVLYTLKGSGYRPDIKEIVPKIDQVEYFLEKSGDINSFLKKDGKLIYRYAFLSDRDFTIPEVRIECFSPLKGRYYTLKSSAKNIKVISLESKDLLDDENSYPTDAFDYTGFLSFINGLLLFLAGFAVAKLDLISYIKRRKTESDPIYAKIREAKGEKELLRVLLSSNRDIYKDHIRDLEESIYESKKADLSKIKDELSKL